MTPTATTQLLGIFLAAAFSAAAVQAAEKVTVQLPFTHQFQFAGFYAAEAKGFFREEGLQVALREGRQDIKPIEEVMAGRADYGVYPSAILLARLNGAPLVAVAAIFQYSPFLLAVQPDSGITTPADLLNKRLALGRDTSRIDIQAMLLAEGLNPTQYTLVPSKWDEDEVMAGKADAMSVFATDAPYDFAQKGIGLRYLRPTDYGIDFYGDCLFTSDTEARQHTGRVVAMRRALLRGWEYAVEHPEEIINWMQANLTLPAHVTADRLRFEATATAKHINAGLVKLGHMNPGRWEVIGNMYVRLGHAPDTKRLEGFCFDETGPHHPWLRWLWWAAGAAAVVVGSLLLLNWRLRSLVARRTADLEIARQREHELFDKAPIPMVTIDYGAVAEELEKRRAQGMTDLAEQLRREPELPRCLGALVRVTQCNQAAFAVMGCDTLEDANRMRLERGPEAWASFGEELHVIWQRQTQFHTERTYVSPAGRRIETLLHWSAPMTASGPDYRRVNAAFTLLTEVREAEAARRELEEKYRQLFQQATTPIVTEDYRPLVARLEQLRTAGVKDIRAHLERNPNELPALLELTRVTEVNPAALAHSGAASAEEHEQMVAANAMHTEQSLAMFREQVVAVWEGRRALTLEKTFRTAQGRPLHTIMNWSVAERDGQPDYSRVTMIFSDITEVKRAEAALRESEEQHRRLFDENPNPMYIYDRETLRFLEVNQAAVERYGYTREEFLARTIFDIRPPDEQVRLREMVSAPPTAPVPPYAGQWRHVRKDGTVRHVEVFTRNITQQGRPAVLVLPIDLTDKINTERELRQSEERYRLLFEQSPLAIVEFDYSGLRPWFAELRSRGVTDLAAHLAADPAAQEEVLRRAPLVDLNEPTIRLLGGSSKQELVARLKDIYTPNTVRVRCENAIRIWNGVTMSEGEIEVRRLDGELRTLAFYWRMQTSEDGQPSFRRTQTVLVDITERKRTEAALRESEARYREVFENAIDGIYRASPDGKFLAVNPALARMLGFASPEELIVHDANTGGAPLYVKPGRREEFRALLKGGRFVTGFESEVRRKDGERIWISENVRAVTDADGRVRYYEGFVSDITPRRRLEAELTRASKLEAVGILAGGIAHDFNNILTVVLGNITLAEQDTEAQASVSALLRDAKRATLRARDLTQQLLTFAKGGDPVRAAIELPELLRESVEFALHGAKARAEYAIASDLWPVNADKGQLGQVVQNLVINAVQAMPQGLVVTVRAENRTLKDRSPVPLAPGRYVRLSVEDTGVGIPAEHLAKIFDPYFTTKQTGSGLGLATVYSIVKKHQGHIEVESQLGVGTKFHIWLPAAEARPAPAPARRSDGEIAGARILFMDDEEGIRTMATLFINRLGAEVELAQDGAQAVEKFLQARAAGRPFDAVIMDLTVPGGMGGREAMERLLDLDPGVKVIVSSGYSRDPVMANHRAHGFKGILPKPYGLDQMRAALHTLLQGRNSAAPFS